MVQANHAATRHLGRERRQIRYGRSFYRTLIDHFDLAADIKHRELRKAA
jgi:hypothetical protein